jgi:hypothetical protein
MESPSWYVYQNSQQLGPFAKDVLMQMLETQMVREDAYLFCVGWRDWRPLEDCKAELYGLPHPPAMPERRASAPRATVAGRIIVHNNGHLVIGVGVNISASGIFIETRDQLFQLGEVIKLSCRCDEIEKPFNATAEVIRYSADIRMPIGYGLKFNKIPEAIVKRINELVQEKNDIKLRKA